MATRQGAAEKIGAGRRLLPAVVFLFSMIPACTSRSKPDDTGARELIECRTLIGKGQFAEALPLFRQIEGRIGRDNRYYNACLAFALESADPAVQEEYANKFLRARHLPVELQPYKPRVYARLAALARSKLDVTQARKYIDLALSLTRDPQQKRMLEAEESQLDLIGAAPPPIRAETWFPPAPVTPDMWKGKAVIIVFWAPWCPHCRKLLPGLEEAFERHEKKGLMVIGCTKLYGSFAENGGSRDPIAADEETSRIGRFIAGSGITFPMAVGREGADFETYQVAAVPTLVWIGRNGAIRDIQAGVDDPQVIGDRIAAFIEGE
jgi:thiol-disulfide isomerase/thioredoxin